MRAHPENAFVQFLLVGLPRTPRESKKDVARWRARRRSSAKSHLCRASERRASSSGVGT